jgi:hypothetical protein
MNRFVGVCSTILMCVLSLLATDTTSKGASTDRDQPKRPVSVQDAIRMTVLGDPSYYHSAIAQHVAEFSQDRKNLVVVVRRGQQPWYMEIK